MKALIILRDAPHRGKHFYNATRLAQELLRRTPNLSISVCLTANAVLAATAQYKARGQRYDIRDMLKHFIVRKGQVLVSGRSLDARGIANSELIDGARRSSEEELAAATSEADILFQ